MSGKVELTIERYEELTEIERNLKEKEKEIKDLKKEALDTGNVLVYRPQWSFFGSGEDACIYQGRDGVLKELTNKLEQMEKAKNNAQGDLKEYADACFSDRLCYLFLGRLPGKE